LKNVSYAHSFFGRICSYYGFDVQPYLPVFLFHYRSLQSSSHRPSEYPIPARYIHSNSRVSSMSLLSPVFEVRSSPHSPPVLFPFIYVYSQRSFLHRKKDSCNFSRSPNLRSPASSLLFFASPLMYSSCLRDASGSVMRPASGEYAECAWRLAFFFFPRSSAHLPPPGAPFSDIRSFSPLLPRGSLGVNSGYHYLCPKFSFLPDISFFVL